MSESITLSAGTVLLTEPAEGTRSFVAGLWFPMGSRHEAPRERGFVHFIEHMLFKGTSSRTASGIARELDRVGGYINAFTEKDCVCIHCMVPASAWTVAVDVLVDMVFASTFPQEEFAREQDVVASEILQVEDDPDETSHDTLMSRIWPGDPASLPIAGGAADVLAMNRDEVFSFYRRHFTPSSMLAAVSSPFSQTLIAERFNAAIDAAMSGIGFHEPSLTLRSSAGMRETAIPRFTKINSFHTARTSQVYYYQAAQLDPPFERKDYYTLSALNSIVGEASGSRLFQTLRENRGMCYSVYSGFTLSRSECLWIAQAVVQPGKFVAMSRAFDDVIQSVASGDIPEHECVESVSRLCGAYELALDDPDFRMRRLALQYLTNAELLSIQETGAMYRSIRGDDIRDLAVRLFGDVPRSRFAYGRKTAGALKIMDPDGDRDA